MNDVPLPTFDNKDTDKEVSCRSAGENFLNGLSEFRSQSQPNLFYSFNQIYLCRVTAK